MKKKAMIDPAELSKETGLSLEACELLARLNPPTIVIAEISPAWIVDELYENGLIELDNGGITSTLTVDGWELLKDFQ